MIARLRHRTRLAATVMVLGLLATACASGADSADSPSVAPPTASQPEQPTTSNDGATTAPAPTPTSADGDANTATPVAVPEALQFTAPLVGGGEFAGADYAGKPTVFWFWAPT